MEIVKNQIESKVFFMHMKPPTTTHQMKATRIVKNKVIHYEPENVQETRSKLMAGLGSFAPLPTERTLFDKGALRCIVKWCFPMTVKSSDGQWKDTKPDTHNLNKMLFDCMTACRFWKDDAQVASEIIEKFWSITPGIYIKIERL
jgi:Holliday junction resolvase RusA-like endonuclease